MLCCGRGERDPDCTKHRENPLDAKLSAHFGYSDFATDDGEIRVVPVKYFLLLFGESETLRVESGHIRQEQEERDTFRLERDFEERHLH